MMVMRPLPDDTRRILSNHRIRRDQRHPVNDRLTDKDPVERVAANGGETGQMKGRLFVDGQGLHSVPLAQPWDQTLGRLWQRQPAECVFGCNLPGRRGTEIYLVVGVLKERAR